MDHEKINMGSYNLHFIKTKKFKTVKVSVNFRRPVIKEEVTIRKFLFSLLCDSTKSYPTRRLMEIEQENLYLLNLAYGTQIFGNYINTYVDVTMLNDTYSEPGTVKKGIYFLFDILFNPNIKDNEFNKTVFDVIYNRMETDINSIKDYTDLYCLVKVLEEMDPDSPASFHTWGYIDDLKKINNNSLYEYYQSVLNSDITDIFIVGDVDANEIKELFKEEFLVNTIKRQKIDVFINYYDCRRKAKNVLIEEKLLQQAKLALACKLINVNDYERRYPFILYAQILGGNAYSKLFQDVREKHSYAYTISASTKVPSSIMLISSGIDKDNFEKALKIIKKDLKSMASNINDDELEKAKKDIITGLNSVYDSQFDIISNYLGIEVLGSDDLETKKKKFMGVTKEEIMKFADKVKLDTVVLLYGEGNNEETTNQKDE